MRALVRRIAGSLPAPLRLALKRRYYARLVAGYAMADWPQAVPVAQLVHAGDSVIDAGANVGYVTALLARLVGPSGRVDSFEPVPETFDLHAHAIRAAGLAQVTPHHAGVSDRRATVRMSTPAYGDGGANLYESRIVEGNEGFEVAVDRLDDMLAGREGTIRFIKVDVEGHEEKALRGAERILRSAHPALLVEVEGSLDDPSGAAGRMAAWLAGFGYGVWLWKDGGWVRRTTGERAVDYFFLTAEHENALGLMRS